jgi:hypothetical protein
MKEWKKEFEAKINEQIEEWRMHINQTRAEVEKIAPCSPGSHPDCASDEPGEMIESKVTFMYPLTDTDQFSVKLGYAKQAGVLFDHVEIRQYDGLSEESTCQDVPGYKSKKGRTCKSWAMAAAAQGAAQNRVVKSAKVKAAVAKAAAAQAAAAVAAAESSGTIFSRAQATTGV